MDKHLTPAQRLASSVLGLLMAAPAVLAVWAAKIAVACLIIKAILL